MIVRVVESKRTIATTTSCVSRALASVRLTWAYRGTERGKYAGRSSADNENVRHLRSSV